MGTDGQNGWNEWKRHVLNEISRQGALLSQVKDDVTELRQKIGGLDSELLIRLATEVDGLKASDRDQETRLRGLEQKDAASSVNVTLAGVSAEKIERLSRKVEALEIRQADIEKKDAHFEGKWAIISFIGGLVVAGLFGLLFKAAEPQEKPKHIPHAATIERRLDGKDLRPREK